MVIMERVIMSWYVCGWYGIMLGSIILLNRILFKSVWLFLVGKYLSSFFWILFRVCFWFKCSCYFFCFCWWGFFINGDIWRNRNRSLFSCIMNVDFDMVIWFVRCVVMVVWFGEFCYFFLFFVFCLFVFKLNLLDYKWLLNEFY